MKTSTIILGIIFLVYTPVLYQLYIVLKENKQGTKIKVKKLVQLFKFSLYILIVLLLFIASLNHTNFLDYEKPISYDDYERITFENFRGLELLKKELYGNERFAYVVTSIEYDINDKYVTLESYFHPSRSFVYKKSSNSKELLTHEKYHIKITELFTRKAKQRISSLEKFDKTKIRDIIETIENEEREFQEKYDYDTFHSYVLGEQKRYEHEVDSLLTLLSKYKSPKIEFHE